MLAALFIYAAWLQENVQIDLRSILAKIVEVILFVVCVYFLAVMLDRFKQHRLKRDRPEEPKISTK
jgi:hypothetical protein